MVEKDSLRKLFLTHFSAVKKSPYSILTTQYFFYDRKENAAISQ